MGKCLSKQPRSTNTSAKEIRRTHFTTRLEDIHEHYSLKRIIGSGSFGVVRKAHRIGDSSQQFAIKTIDKKKFKHAEDIFQLKKELEILNSLMHPNIIQIIESFEDEKYLHIVTELCTGGELMSRVTKKRSYSEKKASEALRDILAAINYLHNRGVTHRDIKPSNFLYVNKKKSDLKLIDFGISSLGYRPMKSQVGTPHYVAPEILTGKEYSNRCDIWSVGVIMYLLLCGRFPFEGNNISEVFEHIKKGNYDLTGKWTGLSENAKDLVSKMLELNPKERIDAESALNHPWFREASPQQKMIVDEVFINHLREFKGKSKLRRELLDSLVRRLEFKDLTDLKKIFKNIDTDSSGNLSVEELAKVFGSAQAVEIVREIDSNQDGMVDYAEFLSAAISHKIKLNRDLIWNAVRQLDIHKVGYITPQDLVDALRSQGKIVKYQEVLDMIEEANLPNTQRVTYDQLLEMLTNNLQSN